MSVRSSIAVVAVLAVVGLLVYGLASKGSSGLQAGDPMPTTPVSRLDGPGEVSLTDFRGRWVLVNFWASWCVPCRAEAKVLNKLQEERGGPDFTIVGVDVNDLSSDARAFVEKHGATYPQLRDAEGNLEDEFGTTGVPENYLFNPQGKLEVPLRGPVDEEILEKNFLPLIPEKAPS